MAKRPLHHKSDSDEEKPRNKRRYDPRDKKDPEPETGGDRAPARRGRDDDWDDDWQGGDLGELDEELELEDTDEWDDVDPDAEEWEEEDPLEYDDDDER